MFDNIFFLVPSSEATSFLTTFHGLYFSHHYTRHISHITNHIFFLGGEWRGLAVSTEDCHSEGRGIEYRSFSFFYSKIYHHQLVGLTTHVDLKRQRRKDIKRWKRNKEGAAKKKDRQAFQEWLRERQKECSKSQEREKILYEFD